MNSRFDRVRIQMFFPCAASCKWCRTFLKNPTFARLSKSGLTEKVNEFYLEVLDRYRPNVLSISGGEAILYPGIVDFLEQAQRYVERLELFTSYQYPEWVLKKIDLSPIDPERLVLTHSTIHFLPDSWHDLTNGFPYDVYVENIKSAKALPFRKRVKFVLNHDDCDLEVQQFIDLVDPDDRFELSYKLLNDQNNGFGAPRMMATRERIRELVNDRKLDLLMPDNHVRKAVAEDRLLELCPYRTKPLEVRFAFYRQIEDTVVLKVRYCPYFGPKVGHKFRVGETPIRKLDKWFIEGDYRKRCDSCRLLHYSDGERKAWQTSGELAAAAAHG